MEDVDVLKGMLAAEGVACEITNDTSAYPGAIFYPELWVVEDSDFPKASAVLEVFRAKPKPQLGPWVCPRCAEQLEPQFLSCWKCGTTRDDTP